MLDKPEIARALRRESYRSPVDQRIHHVEQLRLEVHNERRFAVRDEDRLLSGAIDRLVMIRLRSAGRVPVRRSFG